MGAQYTLCRRHGVTGKEGRREGRRRSYGISFLSRTDT